MNSTNGFIPDWSSAPGDTIADILKDLHLSIEEFAERIGQTADYTRELLDGHATITIAVARRLERVLGASVAFWMSRDYQYREDIRRRAITDQEWLDQLPVSDMINFGWVRPTPHPSEEMPACLKFFGVPTVAAWRQAYGKLHEIVAFRKSPSFDSRPASVAAWLRQGEIEAEAIECGPWDRLRFESSLSSVRSLTRVKEPRHFIPKLQEMCAANGVAVSVVRAPNGCRESGATRFLSSGQALLLLSFRHLSDEQFWFSFFHEAGHLVLHGDKRLFLEGADTLLTTEEQEANDFAARILVPPEFEQAMLRLPIEGRAVIKFARKVGVCPGVVVGQLQHHGKLNYQQLNSLKRRYSWEE
jgi:plasmid maintenance system antidote protein VapI